ncbi:DUF7210 family protein [[Haemophilus] ducreyi]|uniref:DUF7210 family protein n=1 Tax=Haemophilus ducreyi TaxID=730 RepID=UPI0008AEE355|nr:hypothetical protein [[Haemophilus] ducreyi]SEW10674.1 hypothetical protein SAMN02983000_1387 [[Haemophilus] ducreyi]VEG82933.1 Uncharacterised protein [[Haemophilus] ducreyi]
MAQIKIMLTVAHTHAGKQYQIGDVIDVQQSDADFIIKNRIGETLKAAKAAKNKKEGDQE